VTPVLLAVLLLTACAELKTTIDHRTSQGPTSEDFFRTRVLGMSGRAPTFDEELLFHDQLEQRIAKYLREHEEAASDPVTVQSFKFLRQVTLGMHKDQVEILLGPPFATSEDAQQMANWARHHWADIRGRADLAWGYPYGWVFYFDKDKLVDITRHYRTAAGGR
jgi:hypothetical protein